MTQRKEDASTTFISSNNNTNATSNNNVPCWWSDQVLSPAATDPNPSTVYRDFVLISEFSELEGPLPLAIVANSSYIDLKHYTDKRQDQTDLESNALVRDDLKKIGLVTFDFNAFVLRVVSVDRSTEYEQIDEELLEPSTPSSIFADESPPPCIFSIPDDTQVYFTDSEHKFFAFTHHLTLFDINARGYVHPVALSYITRDPDKIVIRFEELMERFNEVSIKMKKGNYSNFTLDLKCRLLDLEYTESNVSKQQKPALSMQAIKQAITATKLMIDTLESSISQMDNNTASSNTSNDGPSAEISVNPANTSKISEPTNKEVVSTTAPALSPLTEKKEHTVDPPKDYKPKCIDSLYPVPHFERKLRSLAQLCQEPDDEERDYEKTSTMPRDQRMRKPSLIQKTAAMIPLVFSIIEPQQQQSQQQQQQENNISGATRPTFAHAIKYDMYSEAIKSIQDMTQHLGKSSPVLDVDEEESLFTDPVSSALTFGRTFMLNMDNPKPREEEKDATTDNGFYPRDEMNAGAPTTIASSDEKSDVRKEEKREKEEAKVGEIINHSSAQETGDESYYPVLLAPLQIWKSEDGKTCIHLLEVLRRYQSLIVDVIFSLLTGRTVLIQASASNKSKVQEVVQALSVFVPGQNRNKHQIIDWFDTGRLTDTQIASIKLVGIDKENMDPSIHIEGGCVMDIDVKNGSLHSSPVYVEGQWINQLLDRMMLFSSDESYLAYLHTMFMTMSLKAFVYHHLYVCDEFKLLDEETPSSSSNSTTAAAAVNKGYTSETNSESSTLSRKWSVRLLNYLRKHEDQENEVAVSRIPSSASSVTSSSQHQYHQQLQQQQEQQRQQQMDPPPPPPESAATANTASTEDDQDYSEDNQATVTLQNLLQNNKLHQQQQQQERPRTIVGLFGATTSSVGEPVTTTTNATACHSSHTTVDESLRPDNISTALLTRRSSIGSCSSGSSHHLSDDYGDQLSRVTTSVEQGSFLNFGADDLDYFAGNHQQDDSGDSFSDEEDEEEEDKKKSNHRRRGNRSGGSSKYRHRRKVSDVGPDGVSYTERRGRRYLQEKLKVYGDDQTIVVYLATCVL